MLGIRYIKTEPNTYVQQYRGGQVVREGTGLSFFYYGPVTSLVTIPVAGCEAPFIFEETTRDYQQVTVQGQVTYRVKEPVKLAQVMNFTLQPSGRGYNSDDPQKLPQRVINAVKVLVRSEVQQLELRDAINAADRIAAQLSESLTQARELATLGLEVLGFTILAIKPTPETARALEAEAREQLLQEADEAIYARRNSAVEQERAIKENELNTEIAVENKKRQIRETQMDAERAVHEKQNQMEKEDLTAKTALEEQRKQLVELETENARAEADAKAYGVEKTMKAFDNVDARVLQALATTGMDPQQLIAMAFQGLAGNAENIGQLNITPDLLRELMTNGNARPRRKSK